MNSRFPPYPGQDGKDATSRPGPGAAAHGYSGYRPAPPPFAEAYWETPEQDQGRGWRIALVMIAVFVVGAAVGLATAWWLGMSWPGKSAQVEDVAAGATAPLTPADPSVSLPPAELPFDGAQAEESAVAVARERTNPVDARSDVSSGTSEQPEAAGGAGPGATQIPGMTDDTGGKTEADVSKAGEIDSKAATSRVKAATAAADRRPAAQVQSSRKRLDEVAASARVKPERTRSRPVTEAVRSSGGLSGGPAMAGVPPAESELARMRRQAAEEQSKGIRERLPVQPNEQPNEQPAAPASAAPPGPLTSPIQPLPAG